MKSNNILSYKSLSILILLLLPFSLSLADDVSLSELQKEVSGIPRTKGYIIKDKAKFSALLDKQQNLTFKQLLETPDIFGYERSLEYAKNHCSKIFEITGKNKKLAGLWKSEIVWARKNIPIWRFHFFVSDESQEDLDFDEMDTILIDVFHGGECLPFLQDFEAGTEDPRGVHFGN